MSSVETFRLRIYCGPLKRRHVRRRLVEDAHRHDFRFLATRPTRGYLVSVTGSDLEAWIASFATWLSKQGYGNLDSWRIDPDDPHPDYLEGRWKGWLLSLIYDGMIGAVLAKMRPGRGDDYIGGMPYPPPPAWDPVEGRRPVAAGLPHCVPAQEYTGRTSLPRYQG